MKPPIGLIKIFMKKFFFCCFLSITVSVFSLISCTQIQTTMQPIYTENPPPTPSAINTPTIVWFPPTATYVPLPTTVVTPTVELKPNIGEILFIDSFDNPNNWSLNQSNNSSVALGKNEISLALSLICSIKSFLKK